METAPLTVSNFTFTHDFSTEWLKFAIARCDAALATEVRRHRAFAEFIKGFIMAVHIDEIPKLNSRTEILEEWVTTVKRRLVAELNHLENLSKSKLQGGFKSVQLMIGSLGTYSQIVFEQLKQEIFDLRWTLNPGLGYKSQNTYLYKWLCVAEEWAFWAEIEARHFLRGKYILTANQHLSFMDHPQLFEPNRDDARPYERVYGIPDLRFIRPFQVPVTANFEDLQGYYISPNTVFWMDEIFHDPDTAPREFIPDLDHIRKRFSF